MERTGGLLAERVGALDLSAGFINTLRTGAKLYRIII